MTTQELADLLAEQLDRIEEQLEARHAELEGRLAEAGARSGDLASALMARIDQHEEYHRRHEHRWGLVKLAGRYPFRFAGMVAGAALVGGSVGGESASLLARALRALAGGGP